MRVLYIIDSLSPGGAERSLAAMAPKLVDAGVRLDVAYLRDGAGLQDELEEAGAGVHSLVGGGGRIGNMGRAARVIGRLEPDLVHTTLFEADIAGRTAGWMKRTAVVSSLVNLRYGADQLTNPAFRRWRVRVVQLADIGTARLVTRFHAVSSEVAADQARRLRLRPDRIDVIPRGRDPARLGVRTEERRRRARGALGLDEADAMVLAVASHEHQKGLDVAVRAMSQVWARVPRATLFVAGRPGAQTPFLQRLTSELSVGEGVQLLGARSDVAELFCAADAFILPSRWEGMPGALIEAMALEAPAVVSDIPATRGIIDDGSASFVRVGDATALAEAIVATLQDPAVAERARLARKRFEGQFTIDRVAAGMLGFYERALTDAAAGRRHR